MRFSAGKNSLLLQVMQPCQKSIITCGKTRMEDALTEEVQLHLVAKAQQSIFQKPMAKKFKHI